MISVSKRIGIILFVMAAMLISISIPVFAGAQAEEDGKPYIAVVSKGEQHDFWQQVKLGANAAAEKLGVDITFEGPASESDIQQCHG